MNLKISESGGIVSIISPTRIYGDEATNICDSVMAFFEQGKHSFLFDFKHVRYIDSTGLGVLIALHMKASAKGGKVVIHGTEGSVRELFELTQLDKIFEIEKKDCLTAKIVDFPNKGYSG
ncbi:MAG: STAS domain-containing protein [Negativicutes bacterium]|nr:STAS domain-containing protein [Negativicutes bacterium]